MMKHAAYAMLKLSCDQAGVLHIHTRYCNVIIVVGARQASAGQGTYLQCIWLLDVALYQLCSVGACLKALEGWLDSAIIETIPACIADYCQVPTQCSCHVLRQSVGLKQKHALSR